MPALRLVLVMFRRFAFLPGTLAAALCGQAVAQIAIDKPIPNVTHVTVNTGAAGHAIPRTIFGTFLEPIGNSTYNGLWAQLLRNPSLESGMWSAENVQKLVREQPELAPSSSLGLPLPWEPTTEGEGNRYAPLRGNAANSDQALLMIGLPEKTVGIKQRVYLPAARELTYEASLYARAPEGDVPLTVKLTRRNRPDAVLATGKVEVNGDRWSKYKLTLEVPKGALQPLEAADFVIELSGPQRVVVDETSLMPADNLDGLDPEMVAMVRDLHTPLIRFGGNFTSGYNWRDGVGPRDKRVSMLNVAWGIPELNTFGTDEFLHFCELVHAKPQVALNLGTGTPKEAAEWVKYIDGESRYKTGGGQLWELGNELWGNWNTGWPTLEQLAPRTLAFSEAGRGADPRAQLIATGQDPDNYQQWNAAQLTNPANTENFLSSHFVVTTSATKWKEATDDFRAEASFALPVQLGRQFDAMTQQIDGTAHRGKTRLAFTEWLWGGHHGMDHTPLFTNFAGALVTAGNFSMLMEKGDEVPVSDMTGVIEFAGIWKKRGVVYGTPSSYVFRMYATADADHLLSTTSDGGEYTVHNGVTRLPEITHVPYLDVKAVASKDGHTVTLFAINRSLGKAIQTELTVPGARKGEAEVQEMVSNDLWDANSEARPTALVPVMKKIEAGPQFTYSFPPASVTRIVLER